MPDDVAHHARIHGMRGDATHLIGPVKPVEHTSERDAPRLIVEYRIHASPYASPTPGIGRMRRQ